MEHHGTRQRSRPRVPTKWKADQNQPDHEERHGAPPFRRHVIVDSLVARVKYRVAPLVVEEATPKELLANDVAPALARSTRSRYRYTPWR